MKCKKISFLLLAFMSFMFCSGSVFALDAVYMTNKKGIEMTETEYNNLLNLGFTENEIQHMSTAEFLANKDLVGEIVAQETIYDTIGDSDSINPFGLQPGYIWTAAREITTTIVSVNGRYRYKVSMVWLQIPTARSHEIIGIGIDTNVSIYGGLMYFQQNLCYSANNCYTSGVYTERVTSTGASATYQLPTASVVSLDAYMYFDVVKNTTSTITQLNAYGDFAHAMQTVSLDTAYNNHSINRGGIYLNSTISSYYSSLDTAQAIWTGSW